LSFLVEGNRIVIREAEPEDAAFILSLRLNEKLSRYLQKIENDLEKQRNYICNSKIKRDEYYCVIESKAGEAYGACRLHSITKDGCVPASWIIKPEAPFYVAPEAFFLMFDFALLYLGILQMNIDAMKDNKSVIRFYQKTGADIVGEDEHKYYLRTTREDYLKIRPKYKIYTVDLNHFLGRRIELKQRLA
jgi:RimJ/RimL family protein N-acetyltransferase